MTEKTEQDKSRTPILYFVDPARVHPNRTNVRKVTEKSPGMTDLVASVRAVGVLQPILVKEKKAKGTEWEVVDGDRRLLAAKLAGLTEVPIYLQVNMTEAQLRVATITANLQREDVDPLDEAAGVADLLKLGLSLDEVGAQLGRSRNWVAMRANLGNLDESWRKKYADETDDISRWSGAHLAVIARLPAATQRKLLDDYNRPESGQPVKMVEAWVAEQTRLISKARWSLDDSELLEGKPCNGCLHRTDAQPDLFAVADLDSGKAGKNVRCLDSTCWELKAKAIVDRVAKELLEKHGTALKVNGRDALMGYDRDRSVLSHWDVNRAKKSTPGAKPFVVATGADAGAWFWGVSDLAPSSSSTGEKKTKPIKERRVLLLKRRAKTLAERVEKLLELPGLPQQLIEQHDLGLLSFLARFGTYTRADSSTDCWKEVDLEKAPTILWASILKVLALRIRHLVQGLSYAKDAGPLFGELKKVCEVVSMDFQVLLDEVEKKLPEPKTWKKLNPDGTPKEKAPKASKKDETPESWEYTHEEQSLDGPKKKAAKKPAKKAAKKPAKKGAKK